MQSERLETTMTTESHIPTHRASEIQDPQKREESNPKEEAQPVLSIEEEMKDLSLFQKLKHKKWQIRRYGYAELSDYFASNKSLADIKEENVNLEAIVPWLRNMIADSNLLALTEGLKAINAFLINFTIGKHHMIYFVGDLVDKLVVTKTAINNLIHSIFDKLNVLDDSNVIPNEILRRLDNKNFKFLNSLLILLNKYVKSCVNVDPQILRTCFKAILPMLEHTNKEIRLSALEIVKTTYSLVEETYEELQKTLFTNLRSVHVKELELLKTVSKAKFKKLIKLNDGIFRAAEGNQKKVGAYQEQKIDLSNLLPDKFLEIAYVPTQNDKKKKIEEFNQNMRTAIMNGNTFDVAKDYIYIINLINSLIEEQNILINTEAIKAIRYVMKVLHKNFPQPQLKHMILLTIEKFKGNKKTNYNANLNQLLDDCITLNCISFETLIEIILFHAESNKNNSTRIACINWLTYNFIDLISKRKDIVANNIEETQEFSKNDKNIRESVTKLPKLFFNTASAMPAQSNIAPKDKKDREKVNNEKEREAKETEEKISRILSNVTKRIQALLKKDATLKVKRAALEFVERSQLLNEPPQKHGSTRDELCDISSIKHSKLINLSNLTINDSLEPGHMGTDDDNKENNMNPNMMINEKNEKSDASYLDELKKTQFSYENLTSDQKESYNKLINQLIDIKPHDDHIAEKLEHLIGFVEKMNMDCLQACQEPMLKNLWKIIKSNTSDRKNVNQIFELYSSLLTKMNRIFLEVESKTLHIELKILLLFISNLHNVKNIEKVLDSAYMTCSIDKFLRVTIKVFQKIDEKYAKHFSDDRLLNTLKFYIGWISQKLDKSQNVIIDENAMKHFRKSYHHFKFSNFPQIHQTLVNSISRKLRSLDESSSNDNPSTSRSFETPKIKKKNSSTDNSRIHNNSDENESQKGGVNAQIKAIEREMKNNFQSGLEKMTVFLSSIEKKAMDKTLSAGCLSPPVFLSPNRHWKRGVGREGSTPLKNITQTTLGSKNANASALTKDDLGKQNLFFRFKVEEVISLIEQMCLKIQDKDLMSLDAILQKLKFLCNSKDNVLLLKTIINGFYKNPILFDKTIKTKVLNIFRNFTDSFERGSLLNIFKQMFAQTLKTTDKGYQTLFCKYSLEFIGKYAFDGGLSAKYLSPIVEMLVFALSTKDIKFIAESIIKESLKKVSREELRKVFELELINSSKFYNIFNDWLDEQSINIVVTLPSINEKPALPMHQEEVSNGGILVDDSFCKPSDVPLPLEATLNPSRNGKTESPSSNLQQIFGDQGFQDTGNVDLKELAINLMTAEKIDRLDLNFSGPEPQELTHDQQHQMYQTKDCINQDFDFNSDYKIIQNPNMCFGSEARNPLLMNSVKSHAHGLVSHPLTVERGDKIKIMMDDSGDKWRDRFLNEKERLHQTIELLEKANHGYLNQVTEKVELVTKLENQRKINERLIEKFNEVTSENDQLKQKTKEIERARSKEALQMVSPSEALAIKKRDNMMSFIKTNFSLMAKGSDKTLFIKQFQEVILTSNNLEQDIADGLLKIYDNFNDYSEKLGFIKDLNACITHSTVMENLSAVNHKYLMETSLKLCISESTQKEIVLSSDGVTFIENHLTNEIQILLDILLRYHNLQAVIINLLRCLNENMPMDFSIDMGKGQKMMLKLIVKCLARLSGNFKNLLTDDIKVFDLLIELYKIFKIHPPEHLREEQPCIKEYDIIYRNLKILADNVMDLNAQKAKEFAEFMKKDNMRSIFLDYVLSYISKYYPTV